MKIGWLKIRNYKSYRDSGEIEFAPDFTVIVGKNNSGKSALLQGLRLDVAGAKPHRSPLQPREFVPDQNSYFDVQVILDWHEFEIIARRNNTNRVVYPVNPNETNSYPEIKKNWRSFLIRRETKIELNWPSNSGEGTALNSPSHGQFHDPGSPHERLSMVLDYDIQQSSWRFSGITGNVENLPSLASYALRTQVFVFDAERLNIDVSQPAAGQALQPNARNLPTLLHEMQANPSLWVRFNQHVSEIFPQITSITTPPSTDTANSITISVWQVEIETQREDLAVRLKECGTGVGQVLAILYIAMTRTGNVIAIDEPNSFLHPGASRKLIEILKIYNKNQYIVATHSADLIAAIQPSILHQVTWDKQSGESKVRMVDHVNLDEMSEILTDLGVRLSDVFGADQVIWVEGPTEAKCFPIISTITKHHPPSGTMFVPVRATGDFDAKSADAKQVWDIYKRLSQSVALVPPTIGFSFDRECRSQNQLHDLHRESGGQVTFLPRRLLENHFLHCGALAHAIADELAFRNIEVPPPTTVQISEAIAEISSVDDIRRKELCWTDDVDWISKCHGAKVLEELFGRFQISYSKIRHGEIIARWLVSNEPDHLEELANYLESLWHKTH